MTVLFMETNDDHGKEVDVTDYTLRLTDFEFPATLPNRKANFRFVIDLRYKCEDNKFVTANSVMPSLDTFWECHKGESDKPNYVRASKLADDAAADDEKIVPDNRFCMCSSNGKEIECWRHLEDKGDDCGACIDPWDRLILRIKATELYAIQFKVIDVNRVDAWDKIKGYFGAAVEAVLGVSKSLIASAPKVVAESLGDANEDIRSFALKKLAGGDKVLFRGSTDKLGGGGANHKGEIVGRGTKGRYRICFDVQAEGI